MEIDEKDNDINLKNEKYGDIEKSMNEDNLNSEKDIRKDMNESYDINNNEETCKEFKYLIYIRGCWLIIDF